MPKSSKSKAIAVIDGQIKLADDARNKARAEMDAAFERHALLCQTRDAILKALAMRKKPERAAKTIPLQEASSG